MGEAVAVILAAGKGTRMRSRLAKVLHRVAGRPMVEHVVRAARAAGFSDLVVVVGHGAEEVRQALGGELRYALQEPQLGTGHAVLAARGELPAEARTVMVLCGDTPLVTPPTLRRLLATHLAAGNAATVLTARLSEAGAYGRVVRDGSGRVVRVVEARDASPEELRINEVNTGMYCFAREHLDAALEGLTRENAQGEYYLTDVLAALVERGLSVGAVELADAQEMLGVNDRCQLAAAERVLRRRKNRELMESGVTLLDPESVLVDLDVEIGPDTVIYPWTIIEGKSRIGEGCTLGPAATLVDCQVGDGSVIRHSVLTQAAVGEGCLIGPFAYLRPGTVLARGVKVGDFVELKNASLGAGSKVPHLTYLGDATVGEGVNIGAGTITCNYDGQNKWPTVIEDGAFIGSNTNLVAPVRIGRGAVIGAGSTITRDVPAGALGVERARQTIVPGWRERKGEGKSSSPGEE